jgi:nucleoid-associated protein YgaU
MFAKILIVTVLAAAAVGWVARPSESAQPVRHYLVKPGDSLWSIAASRYGGDTRKAIWRIEQRNGLAGADISAGMVLVLPP